MQLREFLTVVAIVAGFTAVTEIVDTVILYNHVMETCQEGSSLNECIAFTLEQSKTD